MVTGVPIEAGFWSGDYEGRCIPSSHSSDVFRLVDLRPYRRAFADGGAVVQLTVRFNAVPFPEDESFSATLTIFALDESLVESEVVQAPNALSTESLAFSRSSKVLTEFGRSPQISNITAGRGHHPGVFTWWLTGAGTKGGYVYRKSDKIGERVAENPVIMPGRQRICPAGRVLYVLNRTLARLIFGMRISSASNPSPART